MNSNSKLGIFYFPDAQHYHARASERWLPVLSSHGVSWLVLTAEKIIAIPEAFIQSVLDNHITPIIRLADLPIEHTSLSEFELLIRAYSQWGVRYVQLFDRPNSTAFWGLKSWASSNLIEQFIDLFLPYAEILIKYHIRPVFPGLEVAKAFWDTAFLRLSLESLVRRGHQWLSDELILSAYLDIYDPVRPLNWGAGGQERWPDAKPYQTPSQSQDHRGLYIADWYQTLAKATLGKPLPIILLDDPSRKQLPLPQEEVNRRIIHTIQRLLDPRQNETLEIEGVNYEPLTEEILCVNFNGLVTGEREEEPRAWFFSNGEPRQIARKIREYLGVNAEQTRQEKPIHHALLLPQLEVETLNRVLEKLKPFLIQYQPKIIFQLHEAAQAERVWFPEELIQLTEKELVELENISCTIHPFRLDGISIASHLVNSSVEAL
ncbi:MAG: hypothetical protein Kow0088_24590 [Anaerolineales bacterium]